MGSYRMLCGKGLLRDGWWVRVECYSYDNTTCLRLGSIQSQKAQPPDSGASSPDTLWKMNAIKKAIYGVEGEGVDERANSDLG